MAHSDRKRRFTMVEVVLALGVALAGVLCVMALLPVGINASRDAIADTYLPDVAGEVMTYIQTRYNENPANINGFNAGRPAIPGTFERGTYEDAAADIFGRAVNSPGSVVVEEDSFVGLFKIEQKVTAADGFQIVEFDGEALIWRQDPTAAEGSATAVFDEFSMSNSNIANYANCVFVEISWPYEMPYHRRIEQGNFRTYRLELFNAGGEL